MVRLRDGRRQRQMNTRDSFRLAIGDSFFLAEEGALILAGRNLFLAERHPVFG